MNLLSEYQKRYVDYLQILAPLVCQNIEESMEGCVRIDSVVARAKEPERFVKKAQKQNNDGSKKYEDPLVEIQDQIGARITVLYLKDVEEISNRVLRYFIPIEIQEKYPANDYEFGYFGEHFILKIPDEIIPEEFEGHVPEFFELQIKTLFQHAWSEAHHDLGYKSVRDLTSLENRKIAFTAAQAWGADRIFQELANDLVFNIEV